MKTAVVQIAEPLPGKPDEYPLRLYTDELGAADWLTKPVREEAIPTADALPELAKLLGLDAKSKAAELVEAIDAVAAPSSLYSQIGALLFSLVHRGSVAAEWDRLALDHAGQLRLVFDVRGALEALPWERMQDGMGAVFLDENRPAMRGQLAALDPKPSNWPLRVLLVIGCKDNDPDVKWKEERDAVLEVLWSQRQLVEYRVLERPPGTALKKMLGDFEPHVFHFIGHGGIDPVKGPSLICEQAQGDALLWGAADIYNAFHNTSVRFAFLNACRSAKDGSKTEERAVRSLPQAFRKAGVRAVLGMRADVRGDVAAIFAEAIYRSLAHDELLDAAVARARHAAYALLGLDLDQRDWFLPSLEVAAVPEAVMPLTLGVPSTELKEIERSSDFTSLRDFVDRRELRWSLSGAVDPPVKSCAPQHLTLVRGDHDYGKTATLSWCLTRCLIRRQEARLVDLNVPAPKEPLNYVEILRAIADGDPGSKSRLKRPLDPRAFDRFRDDLNRALGHEKQTAWDGESPVDDAKYPLQPAQFQHDQLAERLIESFRGCLSKAAGGRPLVIALDHLFAKGRGGIQADHFQRYIMKYLVSWVAVGDVPNVRMILVADDAEWEKLELSKLEQDGNLIALRPFPLDQFVEHGTEYLIYKKKKRSSALRLLTTMVEEEVFVTGEWRPSKLQDLAKLLGLGGGGS